MGVNLRVIDTRVLSPGARLREVRRRRNQSTTSLARLIGVSQSTVSEWEHDRYKPKAEALARLVEVLQVPVEELLTGVHHMTVEETAEAADAVAQAEFNRQGMEQARIDRNMTQAELASLVGVDLSVISRIENDRRVPTARQRIAIENTLNVNLRRPASPEWDAYLLSQSLPERWPDGLMSIMRSDSVKALDMTLLDGMLLAAASEHPDYFRPRDADEWVALLWAVRRDYAWVRFRLMPDLEKETVAGFDELNREAGERQT
jgi:transcriptional regulator with XRE-family HTH domain